jgi:hypothetical protein
MKAAGTSSRRRSRGQALVEFALVAPLLFLLIIGIIEAGRLVYYYHSMNHAAREGARYAIVHGENIWVFGGCSSGPVAPPGSSCDPPADNIKARILEAGAPALDPANIGFGWSGDTAFPIYTDAYGGDDPYNRIGNNVTIHIQYSYSPILLLDLFGPVTLQAEATLVINN